MIIEKIIHRFLLRRHFWRYASFSEIAELYVSRLLRIAALNMIATFTSIYMYQNGYSLAAIAFIWAGFYLFKSFVALPLAAYVARIGPKHGVLISNILYIPAAIGLVLFPETGAWVLYLALMLQGTSSSLYAISYDVDFSKVKNTQHFGKEIAYMNIIEKVTAGVSPLIGGFLAYFFGPQAAIIVGALLFMVAAAPLLQTGEPVRTRQRIRIKELPWNLVRRHSIAHLAYGFDVSASSNAWSLFLAVIVFTVSASDNTVYAATGVLTSIVLFVALLTSYLYGKLIDGKYGDRLMRVSTLANSATHLLRTVTNTPIQVLGLNAANEAATAGYRMPYVRGVYDNADLSGHRIAYLGVMDVLACLGASAAMFALGLFAVAFSNEELALRLFFAFSAAVVLLVLTARFPLYRRVS